MKKLLSFIVIQLINLPDVRKHFEEHLVVEAPQPLTEQDVKDIISESELAGEVRELQADHDQLVADVEQISNQV